MILYHELRALSPSKAREIIRKVLQSNAGNVSVTARIMGISRATVRRAREGSLDDHSRRPHRSPSKTQSHFEELICREAKRTGFRYRRLSSYLWRKYAMRISEDTVKAILRRKRVLRNTRRTARGKRRPLYDYEALRPFEQMQLDTKHLLDKDALSQDVYEHIQRQGLPLYEWNMIDVCTRARFTAYSHELSASFGLSFITFVLLWLRAHNVRCPIAIRLDNGKEFCMASERKLRQWNEYLCPVDASLHPIPPGAKHMQALVENSHRADDEYFLMIHAERCRTSEQFIQKAQSWQDTWNFYRPSFGIAMEGRTPLEKLSASHSLIHSHVLLFPVMLMESLMKSVGLLTALLKTGHYVRTMCLRALTVE